MMSHTNDGELWHGSVSVLIDDDDDDDDVQNNRTYR